MKNKTSKKEGRKIEKLIVAVTSTALFDLETSEKIYTQKSLEEYKKYQIKNIKKVLKKGAAFPFIERLLSLNQVFKEEAPEGVVEVILLSRNSPETGLRAFESIKHYGLDIKKAGFFSGKSPYKYIKPLNALLFLSKNIEDVRLAIKEGAAGGLIQGGTIAENKNDNEDQEVRIAYDFDGVLADLESEKIWQRKGPKKYKKHETKKVNQPLNSGPLNKFARKIAELRDLETNRLEKDPHYKRILNLALVTARTAPEHQRAIVTLKKWGIEVDISFFIGDTPKKNILEEFKPHIYFDDKPYNIDNLKIPSVLIPITAED